MNRLLPLLCSLLLFNLHTIAQKDCPDADYKERMLSANPTIVKKLKAVERFIRDNTNARQITLSATSSTGSFFSLPDVITIPVVVHIVYNTDAQNVSDALVQSQIAALNNDYRKQNTDQTNIPSYFMNAAADCGIQFKLAVTDPKGTPTNGIVRRKTSIENFGTDDRVKYTSQGGDDAWDASRYLNIWVCNLTGGVIGYSSVVGCDPRIDGVVLYNGAFGVTPASGSSFNKGRTATHEIGHWLSLIHIWGNTYCGDDQVDDTPQQRSPNRGCPSGESFTCGTTDHGDMYMNYMDLTNDACMNMFTAGQRQRMRSLFMPGGPRNSLLTSNALSLAPQAGALPGEDVAVTSFDLQIYPNPAATFINFQSNTAGITFIIYNHLGQPVKSIISQAGTTTAAISHLANGIYYLKAKDNTLNKTVKFIKAG